MGESIRLLAGRSRRPCRFNSCPFRQHAGVAQRTERVASNHEAGGLSPSTGSIRAGVRGPDGAPTPVSGVRILDGAPTPLCSPTW